jgi:hypothetical protein
MDKTKVSIDYKLQVTTNPTGEQFMVPAITNRKASLDLTDVVKNAIKCCRIAALKNEAVEPIAVALAEEIYDALKNGEAVNFDGYFAVAPYLDGTTDANGQLTEENLVNARLHKGEKFKLNLKDFSWHLEGSELDPSITRLANASDGAKAHITAGENLSIVGTNLAQVNEGDETTVEMKLGDETQSFGPGAFEKQSAEQIVLATAGDMTAGEWAVTVKRVAADGRAYISKPAKVTVKAG